MSNANFYSPSEIKELYRELVPAYQTAFAGPPWNEASICPDELGRCEGGLSAVPIGNICPACNLCPALPAYPADELTSSFEKITADRPAQWYIESNEKGLTLAALGWKAKPSEIAQEKYADVPAMEDWMRARFRTPWGRLKSGIGLRVKEPDIVWLDEVFANRQSKPTGNLRNFGAFVVGLAEALGAELVAYRTIEPKMLSVATRDFGPQAKIYEPSISVPDRRNFVVIDTMVTETVLVPASDVGMIGTINRRRKVVSKEVKP